MKNILKLLSLFLVVSIAISCDSNTGDDLKYSAQTERGWVQFMSDSPSQINVFVEEGGVVELDVNVVVPNTSSDLTINYDLVSVSGDDPNAYFTNSGSIVAPVGETSYMGPGNNTGKEYTFLGLITLDVADLSGATLSGPMVFDVVLTGTSSSQITAGLEGGTFKVSQRIVVVAASSLAGTYSVTEPEFDLAAYWGESYQVEMAYDAADPLVLSVTNSTGFDTYFFSGTTMTLGNGGATFADLADDVGAIVGLTDAFVFDAEDVSFGSDVDGNTNIIFGANSGELFYNGITYALVLTKM